MKKVIQFGLWEVNEFGLIAKISPKGFDDYKIEKGDLWKKREFKGKMVWDWLIHLTEKDFVTTSNVNDLNTAFFFAQDYHKQMAPDRLEYISNAQTIYIQQQMLEIKEKFYDPAEHDRTVALSEAIKTENFKKYKEAKSGIKVLDID